ncbi:hypothetical protein [Bacillus sp. 165]|uniref:hypothetical protein n=1 Tax=Bacillus sp. 165 TaxID=1529117 RepID=UPI001AD99533|nr:hypothetical protein [Bacillus sp. 165]MBO9129885.1 hypothetical protein [Bacillus sp. 165]
MNTFFKLWRQQQQVDNTSVQSVSQESAANNQAAANTQNNNERNNEMANNREVDKNIATITNSGNSHINMNVGPNDLTPDQLQEQATAALNPSNRASVNSELNSALIPLLAQLLTNSLREND